VNAFAQTRPDALVRKTVGIPRDGPVPPGLPSPYLPPLPAVNTVFNESLQPGARQLAEKAGDARVVREPARVKNPPSDALSSGNHGMSWAGHAPPLASRASLSKVVRSSAHDSVHRSKRETLVNNLAPFQDRHHVRAVAGVELTDTMEGKVGSRADRVAAAGGSALDRTADSAELGIIDTTDLRAMQHGRHAS
jgi:hypothetical protein